MVNEIRMKQLEKQLDELNETFNEAISSGVHVSDQFREHYRATADEYNAMIAELRKEKSEAIMDKINNSPTPEPKDSEVPW